MLESYSRQFSKCGFMIALALLVAPLIATVEAADKTPKPRQRAEGAITPYYPTITAYPPRVIWGQRVELTAVATDQIGDGVGFYDNCDAKRKFLGTGKFVNNVANSVWELNITADKLHLGPNDLAVSSKDGRTLYCTRNVVTVLPVGR